jgi:hypothetical protein
VSGSLAPIIGLTQDADRDGEPALQVTVACQFCGLSATVWTPLEGLQRALMGEDPLTALPTLSVDERATLAYGAHPPCLNRYLADIL